MNITDKAKALILIHSKMWLSDELGMSRVTLNSRLKKGDWKKLEIQRIFKLSNS